MSKAFTKELDVELAEAPLRVADLLPEGAKNYMTPDGAQRLREELNELLSSEQPASDHAEKSVTEVQAKRRRDQRLRELQEMLRDVEVVAPPEAEPKVVRFGTLVTVRDTYGEEFFYRIVGVHETDLPNGWVSWLSPHRQSPPKHPCRRSSNVQCTRGRDETRDCECGVSAELNLKVRPDYSLVMSRIRSSLTAPSAQKVRM